MFWGEMKRSGVTGFSGEMKVVGVGENLGVESGHERERERERERDVNC